MANPATATEVFSAASHVDSLSGYTEEMWSILTHTILWEWYGLRLPPSKVPWQGPVHLPFGCEFLYCLDRKRAQELKADIDRKYFPVNENEKVMSIFAACSMKIPDDKVLERTGLSFLARQVEHIRSWDDYLFILQEI